MQLRLSNGDGVRLSVSSAPSSSSQGSGPDDIESLGDVYVWGVIWSDGAVMDGSSNGVCARTDVLIPRSLESNVVLDVHQIACGVRHAALVTRQGEVFAWGEQSGGQLGHSTDRDVTRPHLVESLVLWNMDYIACGEYHTCAVSTTGDLFTWGDGTHYTGLLGHGTDASHWIPKKVSGPLDGLQVMSIACGTWHSALITSNGKVFTFGDGTFGVLGHGDRENLVYPKEVESLGGLRTIKVACGVWHTAAIVEVMGQAGANVISRKLFTWGDGDKYRLGHGDKEARLVPTCVPSLIDYNFHQVACGHNLTIGLTTSGHVFTMGSMSHGQLGNPQADGKVPCLVQDRLVGELVEEIACGACHVAVLTSRSEVYTWGRGSNGRLGHGDTEDRKTPSLIEALKDRHVKSISCGSNFTACICIHKWISGADQSLCSGCRQAFGFTKKRHNCYNCGLVHCHACSSRKVLKAALAPTPGKPHRVCDSCYSKLKAAESGNSLTTNKKTVMPRRSIDIKEKLDKWEIKFSKPVVSSNADPIKSIEAKSIKNDAKSESLSMLRAPQVPSLLQLKDISFSSSISALQIALKPIVPSSPPPPVSSRPTSPYARYPSPPHSATPVFSKGAIDSLMQSNEILNQEIQKLQFQVKNLKKKSEAQELVIQKSEKKIQQESAKCIAALQVIRNLDTQLKDIREKLPSEFDHNLTEIHTQIEALLEHNDSIRSDISSTMDSGAFERDAHNSSKSAAAGNRESNFQHSTDNSIKSPPVKHGNNGEAELTEQFEPGVYITYIQLSSGIKTFKRVRFSKKRFAEKAAEGWWNQNKERVFNKYNYPGHGTVTLPTNAAPNEEEYATPSSPFT
ncbi:PH, RCC1 and FYVE domains-containing protein 1-like isoform X3 [Zingiber officinale]|nr:PH, RCC1 and FYVE domains-containing protein 1-like isoform X3 [Zingiber officinale]